MIKATILTADGKPFAHIDVQDATLLEFYKVDGQTVQLGHQPLEQLNAAALAENSYRNRRNDLLETWSWTIREDSPLTVANKAQWLAYLKKLQRQTLDYPTVVGAVWPQQPELLYA